uniref:Uncharacterized protein n=1 Tax=Glossina palpalis gambiensis TaxID=67801 RepID=A0A1B0BRT2_9MUSC
MLNSEYALHSSSKSNGGYQGASHGVKSKPFKNFPLTNGYIMLPRKMIAVCSLQFRSSRERLKEATSASNVHRLPPANCVAVHRPSAHYIRDDQLVAATPQLTQPFYKSIY